VSPVTYELSSYIPEDGILHSHRRENLKSYTELNVCIFKPSWGNMGSQYSDPLRAGRPRSYNSNPGDFKTVSSHIPYGLWGPPNHLYDGYCRLVSRGLSTGAEV
jgi:hypothetical protein